MLETLLKILAWDLPAPEILLENDGDICLDWPEVSVSINKEGGVSWAILHGEHGTDIDVLKDFLEEING
jgi:hypothetical protein